MPLLFCFHENRKSFAERVANGGAGMGTGAHIWMTMAKITVSPVWQTQTNCASVPRSLLCGSGILLRCVNPWISVKCFQGEPAKLAHMRTVSIWALLRDLHFHWKIYQDQQQKTTIPQSRGGLEEMVLMLLRNALRCGLQEENTSGFLDKRQKGPTQSYLPLISQTKASL